MNIAMHDGEPVRDDFLSYNTPAVDNEEIEEVIDTIRSGWLTTGPKTKKFEEEFASYIGVRNAVAVNSCTAALHLALEAVGVGPGDEVITSPYTFCSTANVVEELGAKVVFADIDPITMNIDPEKIIQKITPDTKAIIPVHFAGLPCDMSNIMKIARDNALFVIEDAAHATEANYNHAKIGTIGDITCFSFYATKNLCCGEGGMITTQSDELAERMRIMSLHGISKDAWKRYEKGGSWYYEVVDCGYKYNQTDILSSLGLHQLRKLEENHKKRERIFLKYNDIFSKNEVCQVPYIDENSKHAYHLYPLRIDFSKLQVSRKEFIDALNAENIGASVHFIPLHIQPYYKSKYSFSEDSFPVAFQEYCKEVSLPLYPTMTDKDINDVCIAVEKLLKYFNNKDAVIKKIDNKALNLRNDRAKEYIRRHPSLNQAFSYFPKDEHEKIMEELERKSMELVLETISIYYEDEAWDYIAAQANKMIKDFLDKSH